MFLIDANDSMYIHLIQCNKNTVVSKILISFLTSNRNNTHIRKSIHYYIISKITHLCNKNNFAYINLDLCCAFNIILRD